MTDGQIRLGVIGAGIMGERLMRAAIDHAPHAVTIAGVWDPSTDAMARIGAALPDVLPKANAADLIAACDCVYVASPPASHLTHARAALAAGKTVFCEKPLATDVEDAQRFVAAAGPRGAVNFPFASSPGVATLRQWIDAGVVGTPRSIAIHVAFKTWPRPWQMDAARWLDARAEGGFTREVVSHFLFLTRRIGGALALNEARAEFPIPGKSERAIEASLTAGDLPVALKGRVGITDKDDHNLWTLEGDRGAVRLRDWSIAERRRDDGTWEPDANAMPNEQARPLSLRRQLEGVAQLARGEAHHLATLQEALDVQEVVERILKS